MSYSSSDEDISGPERLNNLLEDHLIIWCKGRKNSPDVLSSKSQTILLYPSAINNYIFLKYISLSPQFYYEERIVKQNNNVGKIKLLTWQVTVIWLFITPNSSFLIPGF